MVSKAIQHSCAAIREAMVRDGLWEPQPQGQEGEPGKAGAVANEWRISPQPFPLSPDEAKFFESLGNHLLSFYRALNRLYNESVRGSQPIWVAEYLDLGKPESLLSYARMKRFRDHLPGVIRPDIILTGQGMALTELDSVPGGMGLTGALSYAYADVAAETGMDVAHAEPIGGRTGMVEGFARMLRSLQGDRPGCVAIVVSDEAKEYRPEMRWMAGRLREHSVEAFCVEPKAVRFTEEGLELDADGRAIPVAVLYRFFELFDLKNVPKSELIMYSAKKGRVAVTPPFKPALEEKLGLALFHHPLLEEFWRRELGEVTHAAMARLIPQSWILDPRPIPPSAVIPKLHLGGRPVAGWHDLQGASQKDRHFVVKPSGFSELAWGSRGVSIGHDQPQHEWAATLDRALASFASVPYILQEYHKGRQVELSYFDPELDELVPMAGRVRLSPYYFVSDDQARLAGILATVCPLDKKVIHGMRDAIMAPCIVKSNE